jgi:signal transduction histidine kinase
MPPKNLPALPMSEALSFSQIINHATDWKNSIDELIQIARKILIFDNFVVYLKENDRDQLEVAYAKAMGRGKNFEGDIAWGEEAANQVLITKSLIHKIPAGDSAEGRINRPYILGLPIISRDIIYGAAILVRFGNPEFSEEDFYIARYLANLLSILFDKHYMLKKTQYLEEKNKQTLLQENFVATITHELKSPLGFIKGYTTTLLRSDANWDEKDQHEFLEIIDQETDHLESIIENIIDSARLQSGEIAINCVPAQLDAIINDVVTRAKLKAPKIHINIYKKEKIPLIQGDPYRLSQVFENLINNAIKYAEGSDIDITISKGKDEVIIAIRDFGPGMDTAYLDLIFNRFFRIPSPKTTIHGSGLGLYISKMIIDSHNGNIYATSLPGKGATFHVHLPLNTENNE